VRIFAGLVGLVIFAAGRRKVVSDFLRMKDRRALLYIAIGAIVGPVFGVLMNMYALSMAPVGIVTALGQISPVMLLPVERFVFKTRVSWGAAAGTVVANGGTLMLFLF
jgi:drug/metabolite transporter (DMT)-like permease